MAVYLKQFSTHAEYDAYINGSDAILPNVSICTTEGDVYYNPYVEPVETKLVVYYDIQDISNPTTIFTNYDNSVKSIARHEIKINLDDIMKVSKKLLKNNGSLRIVHRTDRLIDIIASMKNNNIEPKRIRFIYPKTGKESNLVLIDGHKNGKTGLKILPPLYVHNEDGSYTEEVLKMFGK